MDENAIIAIDALAGTELSLILVSLLIYLLSFKIEKLRQTNPNNRVDFPVKSFIAVVLSWIVVLGLSWNRSMYNSISAVSLTSYAFELIFIVVFSLFLNRHYDAQQRSKKFKFFRICISYGMTMILALCYIGLFPLYYSSVALISNSSSAGFVTFLRIGLYVNYMLIFIISIWTEYYFVKSCRQLLLFGCLSLVVITICACLHSVFPVHDMPQLIITLWLLMITYIGMVQTNYMRKFKPRLPSHLTNFRFK